MAFLPLPADDELSPDAAAAAVRFRDHHPGELSDLDRALLGSVPAFEAYTGWFAVRDELVPYLGERAVTLFSLAVSEGAGAAYCVAVFRRDLREGGDDPDAPQVTEAERLLLAWGRVVGAGPSTVPAELADGVAQTFQPKLRVLLAAYAGLTIAVGAFAAIAQLDAPA